MCRGDGVQLRSKSIFCTRPVRPAVPATELASPIDSLLLAKLEAKGLKFAPEADRRTLLRRLSFDVIGLPPTPAQLAAFEGDNSDAAYEKQVDRLLASEHFGERMAQYWLDVVRYADTGGYHSDNHRDVWLYRDYVIDAFNRNLPFDQFTVEQLAGDLLPQASREARIASGYNRLLQTTEEGGAQPKEYTAKYAAELNVPGLAHVFERGFVTYTDASKSELLGVPAAIIAAEGAVSEAVARAMAKGALDHSQADIALAVTGFADVGDEPGLVHLACARRGQGIVHRECHFGAHGRGANRIASLEAAIEMMRGMV